MPTFRLTLRDEAESDVDAAYEWYELQRPGLGAEFLVALDDVVERVRRGPRSQPRFDSRFRCTLLKRFPYAVYFTIEGDCVIVFAVLHAKRDASVLGERIS